MHAAARRGPALARAADVSRAVACALLPIVLLPVLPIAAAAAPGPAPVYLSPLPDARSIRPSCNVISRFDALVDPADVRPGLVLTVGAASGTHDGRVVLSDDGRTVVFVPDRPFHWGERVSVTIGPVHARPSGVAGASTHFSFTIAAAPRRPFDPASMLERPPDVNGADAAASPAIAGTVADTMPPGFPAISSTLYARPAPGRIFVGTFSFGPPRQPNFLLILDDSARPLFYRQLPTVGADFKVQPDGRLTYFDQGADKFYAMDSSYAIVDSFACGNGYATDLHELLLLPNGHALLIGDDPEQVDMSGIVPGGRPDAQVIGIIVQELDPDRNVVFQWRSWDHLEITDAAHVDLTAAVIDYMHSNALEVDTDGNLLLSSRHLDEITKIDRTTGAVLWRWGGKRNEFTFIGDPLGFSHQHAIRRIANGHVTLFDNGNYHSPPFSRALEYQLDENARTATLVWQYRNTPDTFGSAMGYVQRLDNGNTLIGWGAGNPDITEVSPHGGKVMEMSFADNLASYRAVREAWGPDSTGSDPAIPSRASLSPGAPNPSRGATRFTIDLVKAGDVRLRVFDITGRQVKVAFERRAQSPGLYSLDVDLSFMPAGVYLCRLEAAGEVQTRKIVLER